MAVAIDTYGVSYAPNIPSPSVDFSSLNTNYTTTVTIGNNTNRALVITTYTITYNSSTTRLVGAINVSYNGVNLTNIDTQEVDVYGGNNYVMKTWYLANPTVGTNNLVITYQTRCDFSHSPIQYYNPNFAFTSFYNVYDGATPVAHSTAYNYTYPTSGTPLNASIPNTKSNAMLACVGNAGTNGFTAGATSNTAKTTSGDTGICMGTTGILSSPGNTTVTENNGVYHNIINWIEFADTLPSSTTQAVTSLDGAYPVIGNGTITTTGGIQNTERGFVYDTASHSLPGNVVPAGSGYSLAVTETGTFGTGAFTENIFNMKNATTYYIRVYSANTLGYSYGNEVSYTTNYKTSFMGSD